MRAAIGFWRSILTAGWAAALACSALAGCGGSGTSQSAGQPQSGGGQGASGGASSESGKAAEKKNYAPNEVHVDAQNRKWIGKV